MARHARHSLLFAALLALGTAAAGETVLVVFSDSLSDTGAHGAVLSAANITARTAALSESFDSHWNGRFSNGFSWTDYLLQHPFDTIVNYAYGGAAACPSAGMGGFSGANAGAPAGANGTLPAGPTASGGQPSGAMSPGGMTTPLSLVNQTELYLANTQAELEGDERLVVVWIGGNEMRSALDQDAEAANATLDGMAGCIESSIRSLIESGESRIAVGMPTFYSLGVQTPEDLVRWLEVMDAGAAKVEPLLDTLRSDYPSAVIEVWDVAGAVKQLTLSDPPLSPFENNTAACIGGAAMGKATRRLRASTAQDATAAVAAAQASLAEQSPVDGIITSEHCDDPNAFVYWDEAHPTSAAHLFLARSLLDFLADSPLLKGVQFAAQNTTTTQAPSPVAATATSDSQMVRATAAALTLAAAGAALLL